jgi:CheY-like chemotaxis protein
MHPCPEAAATPHAAPRHAAPSVVVADDNVRFRRGLVRALARRDDLAILAEVDDGMEALAAIGHHRPDVALVDLRMPRVGGLDLVRLIAADPVLRGIPVVLLSASTRDDTVHTALRAGAVRVIDKTCSRQEIGDQLVAVARGLGTPRHRPA